MGADGKTKYMKEIILTKGYVALVDDEDYPFINRFSWCAAEVKGKKVYALRAPSRTNRKYKDVPKSTICYMHRMLLPDARVVDHIDGNGLNNQRANLRSATYSQNSYNRKSVSGFKGVAFCSNKNRPWRATIMHNGKKIHLGYFDNPKEAARVYDNSAKLLHGEFACLNFPSEMRAAL